MRLTVIGCSGSLPGPGSAASCYLVEADGYRVLLDLGSGALGPLQRHVDIAALDAVLLSHLHADHCLDLCGLYVAYRFGPTRPARPLPVYGPAGTAARMAGAYDLPEEPGMSEQFDFRTYPAGAFGLGPFAVTSAPMDHPVETRALRLAVSGAALVFSGDTGPTDALVELARNCYLLLAEASFRDGAANPPNLHLTGREAGEHATRAGAGALVLTHVPPWGDPQLAVDEARGAYGGPVEAAMPGAHYDC